MLFQHIFLPLLPIKPSVSPPRIQRVKRFQSIFLADKIFTIPPIITPPTSPPRISLVFPPPNLHISTSFTSQTDLPPNEFPKYYKFLTRRYILLQSVLIAPTPAIIQQQLGQPIRVAPTFAFAPESPRRLLVFSFLPLRRFLISDAIPFELDTRKERFSERER